MGEIKPQDRAEWEKETIENWAMEGHRLAQTVAYGQLGAGDRATITSAYERRADPVIWNEIKKAGVRLAGLLNDVLR